jgi:hypothetical protein
LGGLQTSSASDPESEPDISVLSTVTALRLRLIVVGGAMLENAREYGKTLQNAVLDPFLEGGQENLHKADD